MKLRKEGRKEGRNEGRGKGESEGGGKGRKEGRWEGGMGEKGEAGRERGRETRQEDRLYWPPQEPINRSLYLLYYALDSTLSRRVDLFIERLSGEVSHAHSSKTQSKQS